MRINNGTVGKINRVYLIGLFLAIFSTPAYAESVSVKAYVSIGSSKTTYYYSVINNSEHAVVAFRVGFDYLHGVPQLTSQPYGWSFDGGLPSGSAGSPPGWEARVVTTEESPYIHVEWSNKSGSQYDIAPGTEKTGFCIVLAKPNKTYLETNYDVILGNSTHSYGLLQPYTDRPTQPVAKIGGPYIASLCDGDTLTLDGSASFDQDQGTHETGCGSCPNDTITAWNWDWTAPLTNFTDASGITTTITAPYSGDLTSAGTKNIGLRVTDNTALAFPGSGQSNLTNDAFGQVTIYSAAGCYLTARGKAVAITAQIQLVWTAVPGAASYDIYRSEAGPNTGFVKIATGVVTSYATYLDTTVAVNKNYWYRLMPSNGGASKAVLGKALTR